MNNESEQISIFPPIGEDEDADEVLAQLKAFNDWCKAELKKQRNWENSFQRWSNEQIKDGTTSYGCCGYGSMCDWCKDNSYGRPCVRALKFMCHEKHIEINYDSTDFEKVWRGEFDE